MPPKLSAPADADAAPDDVKLEGLMRHTADGLFLFDQAGRLLLFNEACERITGYTSAEAMNREGACQTVFRIAAATTEADTGAALITGDLWNAAPAVSPAPLECALLTKSGETRWVEIGFTPISGPHAGGGLMLGVLRETAEWRRLEEQLRLTRKLAALGELASALAHEIKNPLGIIMASAQILINPARPESEKTEAAQFIFEETRRLDERLKSFLQFSRPRSPVRAPQNIHRAVHQTLIAYGTLARDQLEIKTTFEANLPHVAIDADLMQQVFLNLLLNADQAMQGQGEIAIRTWHEGHFVFVEFADQGPGIPENQEQRLFEPFFSTKPQGTGLGLSTALQIVAAHGGTIAARNLPRGGAAFTVQLEAAP